MPLAESAGLATEISVWLLQEACKCASHWTSDTKVCVDIATGQLDQDGLLEQVATALELSGLPPERLELEVNEADLAHCLDEHLLRLAALRDHGVGVALDAFGAGAASLTLLKRMPLTTVKFRCLAAARPADQPGGSGDPASDDPGGAGAGPGHRPRRGSRPRTSAPPWPVWGAMPARVRYSAHPLPPIGWVARRTGALNTPALRRPGAWASVRNVHIPDC